MNEHPKAPFPGAEPNPCPVSLRAWIRLPITARTRTLGPAAWRAKKQSSPVATVGSVEEALVEMYIWQALRCGALDFREALDGRDPEICPLHVPEGRSEIYVQGESRGCL
jgi:hypothetical protein